MKLKKWSLILTIILFIFCIWHLFFRCKFDISSFRSEKVTNLNEFKFVINSKICRKDEFLIAIVCIAVDNFEQRKIIRQTWANFDSIKTVFLLGSSVNKSVNKLVEEENKFYSDIIQQDFIDTYSNLTLKSIMGLQWISLYCPNVKYVLKIDDDVLVNIPFLVSYLKSLKYLDNYYIGSYQIGAPVIRDEQFKWAIFPSDYSSNCYPPYHQGPAYLISGKFAPVLYNISKYTRLFKLEDIYMGILAYQTKTNYVAINGYYLNNPEFSLYQTRQLSRNGKSKIFAFALREEFLAIWQLFKKLINE
ncbi:beta-1-3-galactosyltransferase 1 [Brachionus plicatilis]|uniref:Hexosyltransferase n=1 Tax=Brachionus plicatilis TaxID=10195 RepID=A0A3M7QL50_BRAPC|nr:beta-1-3-galactosyltransferase 1 [Brachionus plicatilis]